MAEENTQVTSVAEQPKPQPSEAELMQQMDTALKSGDFKAVAKVASDLAKFQKEREKAELEAKQQKLAATTEVVKSAIEKLIEKLIQDGKLDDADGVWFSYDFGTTEKTCKLFKSQAKPRSSGGGGGTGKKFDVSTSDLLEKHGTEEYKDGQTFQQAWDGSEGDKNKRYAVRMALLKKSGITS